MIRDCKSRKFSYQSLEYNFRYGQPDEKFFQQVLFDRRVEFWKNIFVQELDIQHAIHYNIFQSSLDTFCIFVAAKELGLDFDKSGFDFNVFVYTKFANKKIKHDPDISAISNNIVVPNIKLKGTVMHTNYGLNNDMFMQYLFPTMCNDKVEKHSCLGYTDREIGIPKLARICKYLTPNHICFPNKNDATYFKNLLETENPIRIYFMVDNKLEIC
jgi:hypothetical protein